MCANGATCVPTDRFFQWASTIKIQLQLVLKPTVNHTQEEHANHYTTVAVYIQCKPCKNCQVPMQYLIYLNKLFMLRAKITTYLNVCKYM
jgi:hypothetical protein